MTLRDLGWSVWVALGLLLVLYLQPNYGFYGDNLVYAIDVEFQPWTDKVHAHHIGYSPLIWLLWKIAGFLGLPWNAFGIMGALSRLGAFGSCVVTALHCRRLGFNDTWSALAALAFGCSFAVWQYGTTGAVYLPTLCALLMIVGHMLSWVDGRPDTAGIRNTGIWFLFAVAMHQLALLLLPSILLWAGLTAYWRGARFRDALIRASIAIVAPVIYAYCLAFILPFKSVDPMDFYDWMTRYSEVDRYWWWNRTPEGTAPAQFLLDLWTLGHGKLFWALPIETHYGWDTTNALAMQLQVSWGPDRLLSLARIALGLGAAWVSGATLWISVKQHQLRPFLWIAGLMLLPLFAFLSFFQPQAAFYRTYELFFLIGLALTPLALSASKWPRLLGGGVLAGLLLFTVSINFAYGWEPLGHVEVNPDFADVPRMAALPDAPLVFFAKRENRQRILHAKYFLDRPVYVCETTHHKGYYSRGPSEARLTIGERTLRDWEYLAPYGYRLLFSQSTIRQMEKDSQDPTTPVRPYVRCYDLVGGRPEPAEIWVDVGQAHKVTTHPAGSSGFVEVAFSKPVDPESETDE